MGSDVKNHQPETTELMHAVLDGLATPAQEAVLTGRLAIDAAAAARFAHLRQVLADLQAMPSAAPPADLLHRVMERLPESQKNNLSPHQLPAGSGVVINTAGNFSGTGQQIQAVFIRMFHSIFNPGSDTVSQEHKKSFKRNALIGGGLAVAVLAVISMQLSGIPAAEKSSAVGTVAPAQRYVADQPTAKDVAVGAAPTAGVAGTAAPVQADQAAQAANLSAAETANRAVAAQAANLSAAESANRAAAAQAANLSAAQTANRAVAAQAANLSAAKAANQAAAQSVNQAAQRVAP